ncbi:RIT1 [Candida oxycetoniae]|uniref:RIT1 n=1 Tax=Candida oxycetoniae TaxID=497107 RepID=A0AAI9SUP0_9ASCO|nr:RIT1 [Candida oxycetoniae]KAI3402849.2 RIT1 [Candida oxycetoniae]
MELIFNRQNDINALNKELKKSSLSFKNRLQSILFDANFVMLVHKSLEYPLVANERCGLWYVPQEDREDTCYFKSTDGHTNVWSFSLRRLNLHLLPIIERAGGVIIVDSTRRGKSMPDALSKTIPIWCAVINSVLFKEADDFWLRTPDVIPEEEHNAILHLIPEFVKQVKEMNLLDVEAYKLKRPLVPKWFFPGCPSQELDESVYSVCCVSSSKKVSVHKATSVRGKDGSMVNFEYIQGSADDHELWVPKSLGSFGANEFWSIADKLVESSTGYLPAWVTDEKLEEDIKCYISKACGSIDIRPVGKTGIKFGKIGRDIEFKELESNTIIVTFHESFKVINVDETSKGKVFQFPIPNNKKGSNMLRTIIPELMARMDLSLPLVILCGTGQDISVGLVLALLCTGFDLDWNKVEKKPEISKVLVKQHLSKLSSLYKVNPSRSTLQSVNNYLFS